MSCSVAWRCEVLGGAVQEWSDLPKCWLPGAGNTSRLSATQATRDPSEAVAGPSPGLVVPAPRGVAPGPSQGQLTLPKPAGTWGRPVSPVGRACVPRPGRGPDG